MPHDHSHQGHSHGHLASGSGATKNVKIAFLLNSIFVVVEFFGALWTGSVAIWADVIHDLGDSMTLGLALVLQKISERKANAEYTYGYARFSLLSAFITGVVLCAGSIGIFYSSIPRFFEPRPPHTGGMILLGILGVIVNGAAFFRLKVGRTQNEKILTWHLFEDFAGWVLVLLGAVVIRFTGAVWVDPLLACLLAVVILFNGFKNLWTTVGLLLQRKPSEFREREFVAELKKNVGACDVHDLHVWSLDGESSIMSLHLVLDVGVTQVEEISKIKARVRETAARYGRFHVTIEIEHSSEACEHREGQD